MLQISSLIYIYLSIYLYTYFFVKHIYIYISVGIRILDMEPLRRVFRSVPSQIVMGKSNSMRTAYWASAYSWLMIIYSYATRLRFWGLHKLLKLYAMLCQFVGLNQCSSWWRLQSGQDVFPSTITPLTSTLPSQWTLWDMFNPPTFSVAVHHIGFVQKWDQQMASFMVFPCFSNFFLGVPRFSDAQLQDCVPLTDILRSAGVGPRIDLMSVDVEHQESSDGAVVDGMGFWWMAMWMVR